MYVVVGMFFDNIFKVYRIFWMEPLFSWALWDPLETLKFIKKNQDLMCYSGLMFMIESYGSFTLL